MLRAQLFGPLAVEVDGHAVPEIAGLKPRSVLAWLLLHPGPHSRARTASLFWPAVLDTSARGSLRNALWTVRAALDAAGGAGYLETGRENVAISQRLPREIDTEVFDRLVALDEPAALEQAFSLVRAPLLADLADEWVLEARDEYRERSAAVAIRLAEMEEERGDPRQAAEWIRRALVSVPFRESAHRQLMRLLSDCGERAEALEAYRRCRAVLSAEFGTLPSAETEKVAAGLRAHSNDAGDPHETGRAQLARPPGKADERVKRASPGTEMPSFPAVPPSASASVTARDNVHELSDQLPVRPRPRLPLVGRTREIEELTAAWEEARCGRGGVALISGAAGLGKSRLAEEVVARAIGDGARRGVGAAFELAGGPPFAPWSEALSELVPDAPAPPAHAAWPSDLARLCRAVEWRWGRPASAVAPDPEQERSWLFEAVAEALAWLSRERPLLVLLEDLHLADRATIALLAYVGRRLNRLPALILVTRRPATTRPDLALAFDALARREALTAQVALDRLGSDDAADVVAATAAGLAAETRARVVAAAEGNPLLAREAARAAASGRNLAQGLRDWVRAPLARLQGPSRTLVDVSAAAGRPVDLGEASDLIGADALDEAIERGCREELLDAGERRVGFAHALVRDACYAELDAPRRAWLHGRLADVFGARPGRTPAEIAHHLLLAGREDEARGYLVTAAAKARGLGALDEAAAFLREATAIECGNPATAAELWLARADTESCRGSRDEHDAAFAQAVALLERSESASAALAGAYVMRGRCLRTTLCHPKEALSAYERALGIIEEGDLHLPELRALALAGRAWVEAANGEVARGQRMIATAERLPEVAADPLLAVELSLARGVALQRVRQYAAAEREGEHAARLARRAGRDDLAGVGLLQAAWVALARGAVSRALELSERVVRGRCGPAMEAEALATRAYGLTRVGRYEDARAAVRKELRLLRLVGEPAREAAGAYDDGVLALAAGRYEAAVGQLSAAVAGETEEFPRPLARIRLAEARLRTGDVEGAEAELARVPFEPAGPAELPETLVPHLERVQGHVATAQGSAERAVERFGSAAAGWRRLFAAAPPGDPNAANLVGLGRSPVKGVVEPGVELGRVLAEQSAVLEELGRTVESRRVAAEAAALADQLEYDGYRDALRGVHEAGV